MLYKYYINYFLLHMYNIPIYCFRIISFYLFLKLSRNTFLDLKNTIFVILPGAISTLQYSFNRHKNKKEITIALYLCLENFLSRQVLCRNTPVWNAANAAKKLCSPNGNFKLYIETIVAPAIHINPLIQAANPLELYLPEI